MNSALNLQTRHVEARIAELGFSVDLPADWIAHALPDEALNFDDPTAFVPLALVTAPHAAIVYAFGARPAHDDGTLHDWAWYHLQHQGLQPHEVGPTVVAGVPAVAGEAIQYSDLGPMVVRFVFLEDGDRLLTVSLSAPDLLADVMSPAWAALLRSLKLDTPRGSRFQTQPGVEVPGQPPTDGAAASAMPEDLRYGKPSAGVVLPCDDGSGEPLLIDSSLPDPLLQPAGHLRHELEAYALDRDSIALDEDHPTNVRLGRQGLGSVPEVAGLSDSRCVATLAPPSLGAEISVPYGWHVLDDGQRSWIFEPKQRVQIHLRRVDQAAGVDGGPGLQAEHRAAPGFAAHAEQLAALVLASVVFPPAPEADEAPTPDERPDIAEPCAAPTWLQRAQALELADDLAGAEALIAEQVPYIGYAASTAEMYRQRMRRLQAAGQAAGARQAYDKAHDWIWHYASMATSGGEGAALSLQRDQFIAQLDAEFNGHEPCAC